MSNSVAVKPKLTPLLGEISVNSDKSISHRAVIIGSMTSGKLKISNFSSCGDCISTLNIFKNMGVKIQYLDEKTILLDSSQGLNSPSCPLDCGNSGTAMRIISGVLSALGVNAELFGDISLSKRPMKRIIEPLTLMGAKIESNNGFCPIKIFPSKLSGITYKSKIASAQVKSSILLAGINSQGETTVVEPYLSRNHTECMLKHFGADISEGKSQDGYYVTVRGSKLKAADVFVPNDISSAAFFMVAALIVKGSDILLKDVGLNDTRTGIIDVIKNMGGQIEILNSRILNNEKIGDIRVKYTQNLQGIEIKGDIIPRLIDEIPVIAVLATFAKGKTIIKDASDLKNKESDRILCTSEGLNKMGANITPTEDGMIIDGVKSLSGGVELDCHHDHRLAMSYYVASLASLKESIINDFHWVDTSFPEFSDLFKRL